MPNKHPTKQQQSDTTGDHQSSSVQPLEKSNQTNTQAEHATNSTAASQRDKYIANPSVRERRVQNWLLVVFTGLVFAVTTIYAYFSYGQWTSMDKAVEETRQNRELEYRAYVGVRNVLFQPRADNPAFADIILISTNSGRTWGRKGKINPKIEKRDTPLPEDFALNEPERAGSKIVFLPSIDLQSNIGYIPTNVAEMIVNTPPAPTAKAKPKVAPAPTATPVIPSLRPPETAPNAYAGWYVYGVIEYSDIFEKPHRTKFCYFIPNGASSFLQCPTFNDAN